MCTRSCVTFFFFALPSCGVGLLQWASEEAHSLPPGWVNIVLWHRWDIVMWLGTDYTVDSTARRSADNLVFYTWERPGKCVHLGNTKTHSNRPHKNTIKAMFQASPPSSFPSSCSDHGPLRVTRVIHLTDTHATRPLLDKLGQTVDTRLKAKQRHRQTSALHSFTASQEVVFLLALDCRRI